jgi:hypothetical protein
MQINARANSDSRHSRQQTVFPGTRAKDLFPSVLEPRYDPVHIFTLALFKVEKIEIDFGVVIQKRTGKREGE